MAWRQLHESETATSGSTGGASSGGTSSGTGGSSSGAAAVLVRSDSRTASAADDPHRQRTGAATIGVSNRSATFEQARRALP